MILIPTHRAYPNALELVSLTQCLKVFPQRDIRLVCPQTLDTSFYRKFSPRIGIDPVDPHWMSSQAAYNDLHIGSLLYRRYQRYEFILTYQLDAFAFRDELDLWCSSGFDFIGAPWFEGYARPLSNKLIAVGNSGFCLRKTASFLAVARRWPFLGGGLQSYIMQAASSLKHGNARDALTQLKKGGLRPTMPEDIFWGTRVVEKFPWFKVADPRTALKFSFEVKPEICYEMNRHSLPFGCHAWWLYNYKFWRPFIELGGHQLPLNPPSGDRNVDF